MSPLFHFKQFQVAHDRSSMKIGTDGVLLGAWSHTDNPSRILDIGTGSGLIALMLAQRFPESEIVAIDLHEDSVTQASENFLASPWSDRLSTVCGDATGFEPDYKFDLIVCNPPFFECSLKSPNAARNAARHAVSLTLERLICTVNRLLTEHGRFCAVVPTTSLRQIAVHVDQFGLHFHEVCVVRPKSDVASHRVLLACERSPAVQACRLEELVIETERHNYSPEFRQLTQAFYLQH